MGALDVVGRCGVLAAGLVGVEGFLLKLETCLLAYEGRCGVLVAGLAGAEGFLLELDSKSDFFHNWKLHHPMSKLHAHKILLPIATSLDGGWSSHTPL